MAHAGDTSGGQPAEDSAQNLEEVVKAGPLLRGFGDTGKVRILRALAVADQPLNPSRIADSVNINSSTVRRHRDDLIEAGLIVEAGHAGNSPLYELADGVDELLWELRGRIGESLRDEPPE